MQIRTLKHLRWPSLNTHIYCRPVLEILRMADADVPSCGKIYDACQRLHEHARTFAGLTTARRAAVKKMVRDRWDMLNSDMHCAGYVLDPEFVEHNCTANQVCFCIYDKPFATLCQL